MTHEAVNNLARRLAMEPALVFQEAEEELRGLLLDLDEGILEPADVAEVQGLIERNEDAARLWAQLQAGKVISPELQRRIDQEKQALVARIASETSIHISPPKKSAWWPFSRPSHQRLAAQSDDQSVQPIDGTAGDTGQVFYTLHPSSSGCVDLGILTSDSAWCRLFVKLGNETREVELSSEAGEWFVTLSFDLKFDQLGSLRPWIELRQ